tara:strand:- start:437 stop:1171 length:735 start_codon:yes stop_codon:yes gene_type:complete
MDKEKVVLITGGAKRIGAYIARYFHAKGFNIILHFNSSAKEAEQIKSDLLSIRENSCKTIQANFSDEISIKSALKEILDGTKRLDVLINNASGFFPTPIDSATKEQWITLLDTNTTVPLFLIKALKSLLEDSKGCVINISDSEVSSGIPEYSLYAAAKAALESLTKSLAKELAPNVRVNAIAPGIILWPEALGLDEEKKVEIVNKIALGRVGEPDDIASAAYLLYRSTYMTGQVLKIDGGRSPL